MEKAMRVCDLLFREVKDLIINQKLVLGFLFLVVMLASQNSSAQLTPDNLDSTYRANNFNEKRSPFKMIGNIWWVGHSEVGSFLITTPEGHILIDSTSPETASWVVENIVNAGFSLSDIRYILNGHTHKEHVGGTLALKKLLPEAEVVVSRKSAAVMASGGKTDFRFQFEGDEGDLFEPVIADRTIEHLDKITLGGVTLTAHLTPGHTDGTTTWVMKVEDKGDIYDAVILGGMAASSVTRAPLLNNPYYPDISEDFAESYRHLKSLKCDVYLYARASSINLDDKFSKLQQSGIERNPFIDPEGCRHYIEFYEASYLKQLSEERATAR